MKYERRISEQFVMLKSKINEYYEQHDCDRICQGDIIKDYSIPIVYKFLIKELQLEEYVIPYLVVLTQDCDLFECSKYNSSTCEEFKQFLPSILLLPAFSVENFREGTHVEKLFNIKLEKINTDRWKIIKQNNNPRYHYLVSCQKNQIPELVIDFKIYFTIDYGIFLSSHKNHYLATINELFRESLSQRFCNYLSRIGLPNLAEFAEPSQNELAGNK